MRQMVQAVVGAAAFGVSAHAQSLPPIRPLGPILARSTEPLASVSQVRPLPGGRLLVNDITGRQLVLFDSTLRKITVVADSTGVAPSLYSSRLGGLIAYPGDSTLFVDPSALSMLLFDPMGVFVRVIAPPRPREIRYLIGGPFGTPGFDSEGHLVYRAAPRPSTMQPKSTVGGSPVPPADSTAIVGFDFARRVLDTVAYVAIPRGGLIVGTDERGRQTFTTVVDPMPVADDWAVLSNGTVAVVRGHTFSVELFDSGRHAKAAHAIPFDWQRMNDDDKAHFVDSVRADMTARSAVSGNTSGSSQDAITFLAPSEMSDYRPAFLLGAARGDAEGNLWVRTTKLVQGGAVYDVIDSVGQLVERVAVPAGRVIAGFGKGRTVYMGVIDGFTTRIERARAP